VPTRIKALVGKEIERVAGGQHHTIFLRRDGVVYGCGSCKLGQVREGDQQQRQQQQQAHSVNM
jgi:alpha-tubulin suppressor-like RCC1 family protein